MDNAIWVSLISGLCVAIPSVIATISSNKKNNDLMIYRIDKLEEKVNKHNNVVERMAIAERDQKTIWRNIDEIKHKLDIQK